MIDVTPSPLKRGHGNGEEIFLEARNNLAHGIKITLSNWTQGQVIAGWIIHQTVLAVAF